MYQIQLENVSVYFSEVCALENINLNIYKNDFLGIIGPNGGGKTTLLKVLLGLIKPSSGTVTFSENMSIGYVPQFTAFDRTFPVDVLDVVLMGTLNKSTSLFHRYSPDDIEKAEKLMGKLDILKYKKKQIGQLSGGQLQKTLIARALVSEPPILLLDEPTSNIDSHFKSEIHNLLKDINKDVTVVMVTHDIGVLSSYVKHIACLNRQLYYHKDSKIDYDTIQKIYGCPVDLIAHGVPHRVLESHKEVDND